MDQDEFDAYIKDIDRRHRGEEEKVDHSGILIVAAIIAFIFFTWQAVSSIRPGLGG